MSEKRKQKPKMNVVTTRAENSVMHKRTRGAELGTVRSATANAEYQRELKRPDDMPACVCGTKCVSVSGCVEVCRIKAA